MSLYEVAYTTLWYQGVFFWRRWYSEYRIDFVHRRLNRLYHCSWKNAKWKTQLFRFVYFLSGFDNRVMCFTQHPRWFWVAVCYMTEFPMIARRFSFLWRKYGSNSHVTCCDVHGMEEIRWYYHIGKLSDLAPVFSYKLRYSVGSGLVEMVISFSKIAIGVKRSGLRRLLQYQVQRQYSRTRHIVGSGLVEMAIISILHWSDT